MSLFRLRAPSDEEIRAFLDAQRALPFTCPHVGATRGDPPPGWKHDVNRTVLGPTDVWPRARAAVRRWAMFELGWVSVKWPDAPIATGTVVGVVVRSAGLWVVNASRIVHVVDEPDRFGFAYGTLPGHVEAGEEQFLVERTPEGLVTYTLSAFSRPRAALARLAYPWTRREQRRFARDSLAALRRALS